MKKAQVQQVFTYILVILVVGTILLLGLRAILNIMNKSCEVEEASFRKDLDRLLSRYSSYGNMGYEELRVPCDYEEICFINIGECENIDNTVIKQECDVGTGNNIFVKQGQLTIPLFAIDNLEVKTEEDEGILCIEPRSNRYYFKLEGIGRGTVQISRDET